MIVKEGVSGLRATMLFTSPRRLTMIQLLRSTPPTTAAVASSLKPLSSWRSASSSMRWKLRQEQDTLVRQAKVRGLMSRAAFKLIEMDESYHIFKRNQTIVDLGFAPGSWSQVALDRAKPHGRVIGIDIIPASPPRGVTTFQGDFLSPMVQKLVKDCIVEFHERQPVPSPSLSETGDEAGGLDRPSYLDMGRYAGAERPHEDGLPRRLVDVVLSDMSEPWDQISGFYMNSLSNPYYRLMNTSGNRFRDHIGSMDLCDAALRFASDTLRTGGHFVCKFYQGGRDKEFQNKAKKLFKKVHREKPESSRSESNEMYLIGISRKGDVTIEDECV